MKRTRMVGTRVLLLTFTTAAFWCCVGRDASASGSPGHLDEFCRLAEYIVIAECLDSVQTRTNSSAKLKVERVLKAPKTNPRPKSITVKGHASFATPFSFQKGRRYIAFVFKDMKCDRQGSHFEIRKGGTFKHVSGYWTNNLICIEKETNTLDKLVPQIQRVLSGLYEMELVLTILDPDASDELRRDSAIALARTSPERAVEPLKALLLSVSKKKRTNGSFWDVYFKLFRLNADAVKELSLRILSDTSCTRFYDNPARILAMPECKLDDIEKHYPMLVEAAQAWNEDNPSIAYRYMLLVFANNNCRKREVKEMLLQALSSADCEWPEDVVKATIQLQIPESVPLLWDLIKKWRLTSSLYSLDVFVAAQVGASKVYEKENFPRVTVSDGRTLVRKAFPEYAHAVKEAEAVRIDNALLYLIHPDDDARRTCLYVGFVRTERGRIIPSVFVLFGRK